MAAGLRIMKSALTPLAKSVLLSLAVGLSAGMSAVNADIQKKVYGLIIYNQGLLWITKIISDEEMEDIMTEFKWLKESRVLIKGIGKTFNNEAKE